MDDSLLFWPWLPATPESRKNPSPDRNFGVRKASMIMSDQSDEATGDDRPDFDELRDAPPAPAGMASVEVDATSRAQLAAELILMLDLARTGGLNHIGAGQCWRKVRTPRDVQEATGGLADLREQTEHTMVAILAAHWRMPQSHWLDKPLIDTPDDISGLDTSS